MWLSRQFWRRLALILFLAALAGCNLPAGPALHTATLPAAIETPSLASSPPTPSPRPPTATPAPAATPAGVQAGQVSGKICFSGASTPAMTVYFENVQTHAVVEMPVQPGQPTYTQALPPGSYQAYAWLPDFSQGGLYSPAVACGLKVTCKDHTPLTFAVSAGQPAAGVDVCDWYAGPFNVPYPPGKKPGELTGKISGAILYPGGVAPALHIVAINVANRNWYFVNSNPGAAAYTITALPPGRYQIIAYEPEGKAGGHADANHQLVEVTVKAGETTPAADINDWTAPAGSFPPDPTR